MFLQGVGRPNAQEIVERAGPGGFEQAVRDADTFFQVELPAPQAWTFTQEDARRITQPVLFVLGAESLALFSEVRELVHAWLPQAQDLLVLPLPADGERPRRGRGAPSLLQANPAPAQVWG